MSDFTVKRYGTDSSGRPIWMTVFMHEWIEARVAAVGFRPVVIQGAFQERNGGGARDSEGAHDKAGSADFRTRDLTEEQISAWVKECRENGAAAYRRDETPRHGAMVPHCHVTIGADHPLSPMAATVWSSYVGGGDGLAAGPGRPAGAPDYEWRPSPLVLTPPEEDMTPEQLLEVLESDAGQAAIAKAVWKTKVVTDDAPKGRYADSIVQRIYNAVTGKK